MRRFLWFVPALGLLPAACGVLPPPAAAPDSAQVAPDAFGVTSPGGSAAQQAIAIAEQDFVDPARTYGRPAEAARAAASVDYLAGELSTGPNWAQLDGQIKADMLQARDAVRAALGVAPGAPRAGRRR